MYNLLFTQKMDVFYYKLFFQFMEAFAFILPALPSSIWIRLAILLIYLIAHYFKIQYKYTQFKNKYIIPNNSGLRPSLLDVRMTSNSSSSKLVPESGNFPTPEVCEKSTNNYEEQFLEKINPENI